MKRGKSMDEVDVQQKYLLMGRSIEGEDCLQIAWILPDPEIA